MFNIFNKTEETVIQQQPVITVPQPKIVLEVKPPAPSFSIYDLGTPQSNNAEQFYTDSYTIDNDNKVHFMQIGKSSLGNNCREMVVLRFYRIEAL